MKKLAAFALVILFAWQAHAASLDYGAFRMLPVLHEGRVKPLDSYARIRLKEFSGHEKINGQRAEQWLAETLFDPAFAMTRPLFPVPSDNIKILLQLDHTKKTFSFSELQQALQKEISTLQNLLKIPFEKLAPEQKELLQLHDHVIGYGNLLRSFSMILPLQLPDKEKDSDYLKFIGHEDTLMKDVQRLVKKKGYDPVKYTAKEKKMAELAFSLQQVRSGGEGNNEFRIIPGLALKNGRIAPWQAVLEGNGDALLNDWKTLADTYRAGDTASFSGAAQNILHTTTDISPAKFRLEIFYNNVKPFHVALLLYALALLSYPLTRLRLTSLRSVALRNPLTPGESKKVIIASEPSPTGRGQGEGFRNPGIICMLIALMCHAFGITTRVIVLQRPPVGTLYEAILFVSFIAAAIGLIVYLRRKTTPPLFAGLITAIGLLAIAPALLQGGESMEMLVAVLNTNFWLSTHVLCITGGYALSILTGCLAHFYLIARIRDAATPQLKKLQQGIYAFSISALLLTAVGTALGGIWADQSWGRFWGWDPKENGALLIVLWLAWLQHGRLAGKLNSLAFAACAAFLNVIVALAWFGVNLLSVGLHSYGFTNGIAAGLGAFCAAEILVIGTLWFYGRRHEVPRF